MARQAKMKVYDVNLGLAIHIKAPNGRYVVVDIGTGYWPNNSPLSDLAGEDIYYMVITHPHKDHIDDILCFDDNEPTILWRPKALSNEVVMQGVRDEDKELFEKYCEINDRYTVSSSENERPSSGMPLGGMTVEHYSTRLCDKGNFNNFSPVLVVRLGPIKIVICGDNEKPSFEKLMAQAGFAESVKDADVLVAPHHGRESGYYADFVTVVNPRITIISDTKKSDASASENYTAKSRGWKVHNVNTDRLEPRKCITTRNDGNITVSFGEADDNPSGMLAVKINV